MVSSRKTWLGWHSGWSKRNIFNNRAGRIVRRCVCVVRGARAIAYNMNQKEGKTSNKIETFARTFLPLSSSVGCVCWKPNYPSNGCRRQQYISGRYFYMPAMHRTEFQFDIWFNDSFLGDISIWCNRDGGASWHVSSFLGKYTIWPALIYCIAFTSRSWVEGYVHPRATERSQTSSCLHIANRGGN